MATPPTGRLSALTLARQVDGRLDGRPRLRTVLPTARTDETGRLSDDIEHMRARQVRQRFVAELFQTDDHGGAYALHGQQGTAFFGRERQGGGSRMKPTTLAEDDGRRRERADNVLSVEKANHPLATLTPIENLVTE